MASNHARCGHTSARTSAGTPLSATANSSSARRPASPSVQTVNRSAGTGMASAGVAPWIAATSWATWSTVPAAHSS